MNKRFLIGALLVALSATGYAATVEEVRVIATTAQNNAAHALIQNSKQDREIADLQSNKADVQFVVDEVNKTYNELNAQKVDKSEFNDLQAHVDAVEADKDALRDEVKDNKQELNDKIDANTDKLQQQIDKNNHVSVETDKQLNEKIDTNTEALNNKIEANKAEADQKHDSLQQQIDKNNHVSVETDKQLNEKIDTNTEALNNKIDKNTQDLNNKVDANKQELNNKIDKNNAIVQGQIDGLDNKVEGLDNRVDGIVQSNKVENDKQNNRLDKVESDNKVQNDAIAGLQSQTNQNSNQLHDLNNKVDANKAEQDKINKDQAQNNKDQQNAIDKNTQNIASNTDRLNTLQQDFAKYDGRLTGLEKKVDNLDNKMNKGMSLMAAMNAVDFQNVQSGEMAIGAGIGHYGNAQSVAVGVAYAPTEDVSLNAKYSITAGDVDSFAVGAGASYKFKVGR